MEQYQACHAVVRLKRRKPEINVDGYRLARTSVNFRKKTLETRGKNLIKHVQCAMQRLPQLIDLHALF